MSMPTQNTVTRTLRGVVTATLLLASAGASAQQAAASEGLEEIIVTATKKANAIIDTPAAISAITAEQMGAGGIEDVSDLATAVPSLSVGDQFGVNRTFIRGVGMTSIDLGADGAVAFLQDGAMIARPSAQLSGFYDLEQVEVLRGPQGTTYGRGATAGVINLVTRKVYVFIKSFNIACNLLLLFSQHRQRRRVRLIQFFLNCVCRIGFCRFG